MIGMETYISMFFIIWIKKLQISDKIFLSNLYDRE